MSSMPTLRFSVSNKRWDGTSKVSWQYDYLIEEKKNELDGNYQPTRDNFGPLFVPDGNYFCLGDNRDASSDSRYWGFVDRVADQRASDDSLFFLGPGTLAPAFQPYRTYYPVVSQIRLIRINPPDYKLRSGF